MIMLSMTLFISGSEIFIILLVVLLLFGANKLPEIARGLGKGMNEFKRATRDIRSEFDEQTRDIQNEVKDIKKDIEDQTRFNVDEGFFDDDDSSQSTTQKKDEDAGSDSGSDSDSNSDSDSDSYSDSDRKGEDSSTSDGNKPAG